MSLPEAALNCDKRSSPYGKRLPGKITAWTFGLWVMAAARFAMVKRKGARGVCKRKGALPGQNSHLSNTWRMRKTATFDLYLNPLHQLQRNNIVSHELVVVIIIIIIINFPFISVWFNCSVYTVISSSHPPDAQALPINFLVIIFVHSQLSWNCIHTLFPHDELFPFFCWYPFAASHSTFLLRSINYISQKLVGRLLAVLFPKNWKYVHL